MSAIPVISYTVGIAVFSAVGWLLNGIKDTILDTGLHQTNDVYSFFVYLWAASFVVFLIGGGIYVIRRYNERSMMGGYR